MTKTENFSDSWELENCFQVYVIASVSEVDRLRFPLVSPTCSSSSSQFSKGSISRSKSLIGRILLFLHVFCECDCILGDSYNFMRYMLCGLNFKF